MGWGDTFFAEQGAKSFLDRKITVFPGSVPAIMVLEHIYNSVILNILLTDSAIKTFMAHWRKTWPSETVTPKMHILEEHVVPFIRKWKLGLGFYGEQGNFLILRNNQISTKWMPDWQFFIEKSFRNLSHLKMHRNEGEKFRLDSTGDKFLAGLTIFSHLDVKWMINVNSCS